MKLLNILPLAAVGSAFVLPDDATIARIPIKKNGNSLGRLKNEAAEILKEDVQILQDFSTSVFDNAINAFKTASREVERDVNPWIEGFKTGIEEGIEDLFSTEDGPHHPEDPDHPDHPPHRKPKKPHHPGHRNPHHGYKKPNETIYQMIQQSKYTTKLLKLVDEHPDIVNFLNSTNHNITLFAPTDDAFDKIPEHHKKPSEELVQKILQYHVVPDSYDAKRLLLERDTVPTALVSEELGGYPQRIRTSLGLKGLKLNFYSNINAGNILATNGFIHGIDALLIPPPHALTAVSLMPSSFSTLELALERTGLASELKDLPHHGLTFFSPDNHAFAKLGRLANAFLFSEKGKPYLKKLLQYHVVVNQTLYSDEYYPSKHSSTSDEETEMHERPIHLDMPTLLEGANLGVDVRRFWTYRNIRVNGYNDVHVKNGIARDGVLQVLSSVIIPPKKAGDGTSATSDGEEIGVEELKMRIDGAGAAEKKGWWEGFEL